MDKIHLKRLKRTRKLAGRIECHGNKLSCLEVHAKKRPMMMKKAPVRKSYEGGADFFKQKAPKKSGFFSKLFKKSLA